MKKSIASLLFTFAFSMGIQAQDYKVPVTNENEKMAEGQYQPQWESLKKHKTPEWFRNAKFGIWAHWGPQCVEGSGDWMAREMYIEGSHAYKYHVEHYGHPSEFGFKDILPLFKAEKWDPDKLVVKSLAKGNPHFRKSITRVELLGYGKIKAKQTAEGLEVQLPSPTNDIAPVLKIAK